MTHGLADVLVLGGGPAGVFAARRAANLGAKTTLVASGQLGGMAATDGPVPVRTLAHAARLMRDAEEMPRYGIRVGSPSLDYAALLARVSEVVKEVRAQSIMEKELAGAGVEIHEGLGHCRFIGPRTIETRAGRRFSGDRIILCTGGRPRQLTVPGAEHVASHSGAWA